MTNQPKTEVEIDGKTWPLVQQWHFYKYADENGDWHVRESDSPLPTRPAPEAKAEAEAGDGWEVKHWYGDNWYVVRDVDGPKMYEFLRKDASVTNDGEETAVDFPTRAAAEAALAKWREKQKKPEPTLADEAWEIEREAMDRGEYRVADLASLLRRRIEGEGK